jgi:glutaredoxin
VLSTLLLLAALAASPLDVARDHLKAGRLDDVLFTLDGKTFDDADKPRAAALLGEAAEAANKKKDDVLALQFAQTALTLDKSQPKALEAAARASLTQQLFDAAEKYADRWVLVDRTNPSARVLRAQLAVEAGEWDVAIDQLDQVKDAKGSDAELAKTLRAKATSESSQKHAALSTIASLEKAMAAAAVAARHSTGSKAGAPSNDVVLYGTSWCGYCKKARAWLKKKDVAFTERDVEKEPAAAQELATKAANAGLQTTGVPVIDVHGQLVLGFDEPRLESLF